MEDSTIEKKEVGKRLKAVSQLFGGVAKLGELIGISKSQMSNYTTGYYGIDMTNLKKIGSVGINLNWLLTGEGEMLVNQEFDSEAYDRIEDFQSQVVELNKKLGKFLGSKYIGRAAAGRPPKEDEE